MFMNNKSQILPFVTEESYVLSSMKKHGQAQFRKKIFFTFAFRINLQKLLVYVLFYSVEYFLSKL